MPLTLSRLTGCGGAALAAFSLLTLNSAAFAATCATPKLADADLRISPTRVKRDKDLDNTCWAKLKTCADASDKIRTCSLDAKPRAAKLRNTAPPPPPPSGVCTTTTAETQFFDREPNFKNINTALAQAFNGLTSAVAADKNAPPIKHTGPTLKAASFGPKNNVPAQLANRENFLTQLTKIQGAFDKEVQRYSTLSSADCFVCTVLENYAVLQGAVNLINYSYTFGPAGVRVGLNKQNTLANTDYDSSEQGSMELQTKLRIAEPSPSLPSEIDLTKKNDQWMGVLDGEIIDALKKQICKLVKATNSNAYSQGAKYFEFARDTQLIVNGLFNFNSAIGGSYSEQAENASKKAKNPQLMPKVWKDFGPAAANATKKAQCATSGKELKSFHPRPSIDTNKYLASPSWCN